MPNNYEEKNDNIINDFSGEFIDDLINRTRTILEDQINEMNNEINIKNMMTFLFFCLNLFFIIGFYIEGKDGYLINMFIFIFTCLLYIIVHIIIYFFIIKNIETTQRFVFNSIYRSLFIFIKFKKIILPTYDEYNNFLYYTFTCNTNLTDKLNELNNNEERKLALSIRMIQCWACLILRELKMN